MIVDVLPENIENHESEDTEEDDYDDDVVDGQMTTDRYDIIKYDEISVNHSESDDGESESSDYDEHQHQRHRLSRNASDREPQEQPLKILVHDDQGQRRDVIQHDHHFVMNDNAKSKSGSVLEYPSEEMAEPNSLDIGDESQCGASTELTVTVTEVARAHN